jgi:hypothetical protein
MRPRSGITVVLALLIGAVPTVVSLCGLKCAENTVVASRVSHRPCHATGNASPTDPYPRHRDCTEHVLLAKAGGSGIQVILERASTAIRAQVISLAVIPDQRLESERLDSADLSPPFSRSSDILRL